MRKYISACHLFLWAIAVMAGITTSAQAYTTGNLLGNPGFDSGPLINATDILNSPYTTGDWGAENGSIVGTTAGVTPAGGTSMLSELASGAATQTFQLTDVSAYAADISAGTVTADLSAFFDVPDTVLAGIAGVSMTFYDASHNVISFGQQNINTDSLTNTWELDAYTGVAVPVNTSFILSQVFYGSDSLGSDPGFVDSAQLTLTSVPEPSSLALLGLGFASLFGFSRIRRAKSC
jgi:hypothetical protein